MPDNALPMEPAPGDMSPTNTSTPNDKNKVGSTGNEISPLGKFLAGFLLITLTFIAISAVIAYWPNKMPPIKDGDEGAWYVNKCFKVTLIEKSDSMLGY